MSRGHSFACFLLCLSVLPGATIASAQNLDLVSREADGDGGAQANEPSFEAVINANGRFVAFASYATNLIPGGGTDTNGFTTDIFVFDRETGGIEVVSRQDVNDGGAQANLFSRWPAISGNGRYVGFASQGTNLIPGGGIDVNGEDYDIFLFDRHTTGLELVTRQDAGDGGAQANESSFAHSINGDGRYVAFSSNATNLIPGGGTDDNGRGADIFVLDRQTGGLELISRQDVGDGGAQANSSSGNPWISGDGRYIAFESRATNLIPGGGTDVNGTDADIFLFDRQTGGLELISRQDVADGGAQANDGSGSPSISADGRFVAFGSSATNLMPSGGADANGSNGDVFVFDRHTGGLQLVSRQDAGDGGAQANGSSSVPSISADGRYVAFESRATNLIPGGGTDANGTSADIFVFDRRNGALMLAGRQDDADGGAQGNFGTGDSMISADGRFVVFDTESTNLIPGGGADANGTYSDVFVFGSLILPKNDIATDFEDANGLWARFDDSSWTKLNSQSPQVMAAGDLDNSGVDEVIASFGPGAGLWVFRNNAAWEQLHGDSPEDLATGGLDDGGQDEVIVDFGAPDGLWAYLNDSTWEKLNSQSPNGIATGDIDGNGQDEVIASFPSGVGLWVFRNNAVWVKINGQSAGDLETGDLDIDSRDEVIVDFGPGAGLWALYNDGAWARLNTRSPQAVTVADLDGNGIDEVVAAFGAGVGLWVWRNNSAWEKLNSQTPEDLETADLDSSGQEDLIVDFGAGGLWAYVNDSTWTPFNSQSTELLTTGNFDGF